VVDDGAGGGFDDGGGGGVAMGVHADHIVDLAYEHGLHGVLLVLDTESGNAEVGIGLGAVTARQDCDEARRESARLLIRPAIRWARPVPATATTYPTRRPDPGRSASESFGSVVVTSTDTGSDHRDDRGNRPRRLRVA
jgi:hypothetical protein